MKTAARAILRILNLVEIPPGSISLRNVRQLHFSRRNRHYFYDFRCDLLNKAAGHECVRENVCSNDRVEMLSD
jgi:hypothetical protein